MDREESIANAILALDLGEFTKVRAAARKYGVDKRTLTRRRNGATTCHKAHVNQQALNPGEEEALITYIQRCDAQGFPIRHPMLKATAEFLIQKRSNDPRRQTLSVKLLSHSWSGRFVKRHPFLQTLMGKPIESSRAKACTSDNLQKWFGVFKQAMDTYKPTLGNIYNIDETGFQIGTTSRSYVIIDKRQNSAGKTGTASKSENITAIETGCADGTLLPPFLIFKGQYLQSTWFSTNVPDDWIAVTSPNGWTSDLLAMGWLKRVFEPSTRNKANGNYRIIILDGHHSHLTPEFMEYCTEHRIIVLCLPAHTSHMTQPMDIAVFSPVKYWFRREVEAYLRCGEIRVPKAEFMEIYARSRPKAITAKNIKSGFRGAGLVPYNPAAVLRHLPSRPLTPPPPCLPQEFLTPKNMQHLQASIQKRDQLAATGKSEDLDASHKIQAKIDKSSTKAFADRTILQQREVELMSHNTKKQAKASKKRKRVDPLQEMTVGQVNSVLNKPEAPPQPKCKTITTRATQRRRRLTTPETSEDSSESIEASEDSDINSCIIVSGAV